MESSYIYIITLYTLGMLSARRGGGGDRGSVGMLLHSTGNRMIVVALTPGGNTIVNVLYVYAYICKEILAYMYRVVHTTCMYV